MNCSQRKSDLEAECFNLLGHCINERLLLGVKYTAREDRLVKQLLQERFALGLHIMKAGNDYFTDKAPLTTLQQLEDAKLKVKETSKSIWSTSVKIIKLLDFLGKAKTTYR